MGADHTIDEGQVNRRSPSRQHISMRPGGVEAIDPAFP